MKRKRNPINEIEIEEEKMLIFHFMRSHLRIDNLKKIKEEYKTYK